MLLTNLLVRYFDCRYFKHIVLIIIKKAEIVGKSNTSLNAEARFWWC